MPIVLLPPPLCAYGCLLLLRGHVLFFESVVSYPMARAAAAHVPLRIMYSIHCASVCVLGRCLGAPFRPGGGVECPLSFGVYALLCASSCSCPLALPFQFLPFFVCLFHAMLALLCQAGVAAWRVCVQVANVTCGCACASGTPLAARLAGFRQRHFCVYVVAGGTGAWGSRRGAVVFAVLPVRAHCFAIATVECPT